MKKKITHTYRKWIWKRLRDRSVASYNEIRLILSDFHKIVFVLRKEGLIKRNVSRYDFYIIRICTRRQIQPIEPRKGEDLRDLKNGKTKCRFEEQLYGTVYPKLG